MALSPIGPGSAVLNTSTVPSTVEIVTTTGNLTLENPTTNLTLGPVGGAVAAHGSSHEAGGADPLVVQNLSSGDLDTRRMLISDGVGGWGLLNPNGWTRIGWENVNDASTSVTPLTVPADTWVSLPNDGLGPATITEYRPSDVDGTTPVTLFDTATGTIDPSNIPLGSILLTRIDFTITPTVANAAVDFRFVLAGGVINLERSVALLTSAGVAYQEVFEASTFIGAEFVKSSPIQLQVRCSAASTVVNSGLVIYGFLRQPL